MTGIGKRGRKMFYNSIVISTPDRLRKGYRYFTADTLDALKALVEKYDSNTLDTYDGVDGKGNPITKQGKTRALWYPALLTFKPYSNPLFSWGFLTIKRKSDGKEFYIDGVESRNDGYGEIHLRGSGYITMKRMLKDYTWLDGSVCGEPDIG